jgi:hypothetical protein
MSRLRRYLPPLVILLPLIFICGKLLLTIVPTQRHVVGVSPYLALLGGLSTERGWPWVYETQWRNPGYVSLVTPRRTNIEFSAALLCADLACLASIVAAAAFMLAIHYRHSGRWVRFTLRELLLLVTIVAVAAGWLQYNRAGRAREQTAIAKIGGSGAASPRIEYVGPGWLRRLVSERSLTPFHRITQVTIGKYKFAEQSVFTEQGDVSLAEVLPEFGYLTALAWEDESAVSGTVPAGGLPAGSAKVKLLPHATAYRRIERLFLRDPDVDDRTLEVLPSLPRLRDLNVEHSGITDAGLEIICNVATLENLDLSCSESITSAGVLKLSKLKNLKSLRLPKTSRISNEAGEQLQQRLPELLVSFY